MFSLGHYFLFFLKHLEKKTIDMFPLGAVTMIISNRLEVAFLAILGVLCGHFWNIYTLIATRGHSLQVNGHISKIIIAVVAFFCLHSYNFVNIQFTLMYCHKWDNFFVVFWKIVFLLKNDFEFQFYRLFNDVWCL